MITDEQMLSGINAALVNAFPNHTVYVNLQKEDYDRPSLAILSGKKDMKPLTQFLVQRNEEFSIIIKEKLDAAGLPLLTDLQSAQHKVLETFANLIAIADRHLLATPTATPIDDGGSAEVILSFDFFDDPPGKSMDNAELMKEFEIDIQSKVEIGGINGNSHVKY